MGRAYLYGLVGGGERGVDRALSILRTELTRTLRLLGFAEIAELSDRHVTLSDAAGR